MPPLLLTMAPVRHPRAIHHHTQYNLEDMDFTRVTRVLLRYGANPMQRMWPTRMHPIMEPVLMRRRRP